VRLLYCEVKYYFGKRLIFPFVPLCVAWSSQVKREERRWCGAVQNEEKEANTKRGEKRSCSWY
jgi:hypothetical protein